MQGQKKDGKVGAGADFVTNSVVESGDDIVIDLAPEGRKKVDKKKVAMIVAGILAVIGVGAGVWWWAGNNQIGTEKAEEIESDRKYNEMVMNIRGVSAEWLNSALEKTNNISVDVYNGVVSINEAEAQFQELIDEAGSDAEKAIYYGERAMMFEYIDWGNRGDELKVKIFSDAYKAEELYPTDATASRIARLEEKFGNKEAAEKYNNLVDVRQKGEE